MVQVLNLHSPNQSVINREIALKTFSRSFLKFILMKNQLESLRTLRKMAF